MQIAKLIIKDDETKRKVVYELGDFECVLNPKTPSGPRKNVSLSEFDSDKFDGKFPGLLVAHVVDMVIYREGEE